MYTTRGAMLVISTRQIFVINKEKNYWSFKFLLFLYRSRSKRVLSAVNRPYKMWFIGFAQKIKRITKNVLLHNKSCNSLFANHVASK